MRQHTQENFDKILNDARNVYHSPLKAAVGCPPDEVLVDYAYQDLPETEYQEVAQYVKNCERCRVKVLKMEVEDTAWEHMLEQGFQTILAKITADSQSTPQLPDLKESIADEIWEPEWVGKEATAADIPQQEHSFHIEEGEVKIICYWKRPYRKKPAYIYMSWETDITTDRDLHIQFIDPETRKLRYEVNLGIRRLGEETFTSQELGFDPSSERWAVSIV